MVDTAAATVTVELDAETRQQMTDLNAQLETYRAERDRAEAVAVTQAAELKALQERLGAMEAAAKRKRYTDLVLGRGDAGDGQAWIGETAKHVGILETLAALPDGEDGAAFRDYVELQRAHAAQLAAGGLFAERGSSAVPDAGSSAADRLDAAIRAHMAQHGGDYADAFDAVTKADAGLAAAHVAEQRARR